MRPLTTEQYRELVLCVGTDHWYEVEDDQGEDLLNELTSSGLLTYSRSGDTDEWVTSERGVLAIRVHEAFLMTVG